MHTPPAPAFLQYCPIHYSEQMGLPAFAIRNVHIRCTGVNFTTRQKGPQRLFTIGVIFAMAGVAVARDHCTLHRANNFSFSPGA